MSQRPQHPRSAALTGILWLWIGVCIIGGGLLGVQLFNRWLMPRITDALHANDNLAGAVVVMGLMTAVSFIGALGGMAVYMITVKRVVSRSEMLEWTEEGGRIPIVTPAMQALVRVIYGP